MAQRYGILPSELLQRGSTFDLFVCNSAIRYQQNQQAESQGDFSHFSEEELLKLKEKAQ
jgi:hypothetical protein